MVNVTTLSPNSFYNFTILLNYSIVKGPMAGRTVAGLGGPFYFTYEKDTTGDGLTDWEKVRGWVVTSKDGYGAVTVKHVTAKPTTYSSNGLINDYVEKEFGLNPGTIDSAKSQMLDTWNLTFSLPNSACPSGFRCWNESQSGGLNPFAVPQTPGGTPPGTARTPNATGLPTKVEDNSPYDATILWPNSDLSYLQGLISNDSVGWLRGVLGRYSGGYTLTIWGKLSWGANPLDASTPLDGLQDGSRANPLGRSDLSVNITGWWATAQTQGAGVAAFVRANSTAVPPQWSARTDYSAFTMQESAGSGGRASFPNTTSPHSFAVTFPILSVEQYASLNLSLLQNCSTSSSPLYLWFLNTTEYRVDLENAAPHSFNVGTSGTGPMINFTYQVITIYSKAPTYIVVPGDNSTVSNLPLGLKRYTGE
ncbi:MAG: hypothetical protein L3J97_02315, partial [Thermoplasmata archaeon]|nr:hypothetical protein [Thermoplasmata archaeon]